MLTTETLSRSSNLRLKSLEIQNYRAFRHLSIPRLGRVNLITGMNNVGKSSLLEAALVYAKSGAPSILRELLDNRDELRVPNETRERSDAVLLGRVLQDEEINISAARYLFHGRGNFDDISAPISISSGYNDQNAVSIDVGWYVLIQTNGEDGTEQQVSRQLHPISKDQRFEFDDAALYLTARLGERQLYRLRLERLFARTSGRLYPEIPAINSHYVRSTGLDDTQISRLWDSITATALEDNVLSALRILAPRLERVVVVGDPERNALRGRVPLAKMSGLDRVPMRSFGDGMNRLFGITLGLVNSQNGIFLVDELDNGVHHSVLLSIWQFIFRVAQDLNIQVFATTHSWDCIEAFQQAADQDKLNEGMLIRLDSKDQNVTAKVFDERRLAIATREQIEVR